MSARWPQGRLGDLLGVRHPIVQGPFGGGLSSVRLAAAVSDAGGLGSYGGHHLPPDDLTDLVKRLRAATDRPFAVNLWVPQPGEEREPSTEDLATTVQMLRPYLRELDLPEPRLPLPRGPRFEAQLDALLDARPPVLSFVMGVLPPEAVERAHRDGILLIGTATTVDEAIALQDAGVDAVVASGSDAGGHRGAFLRPVEESLVGTFSLVPQVASAISVPVIAAGGIGDGRGIAAALMLGAEGVQIGTGFLATDESAATPPHRRALHSPAARVTVLTRLFSGRPARGIANRLVHDLAAHEPDVLPYPLHNTLMQPIRQRAAEQDRNDLLNLWAGQAAPLSRPGRAADYLTRLVTETQAALDPEHREIPR